MNERIQQLSDIAYKNHLARNPHSSFGRRPDYEREFAELIVRECATMVKGYEFALGRDNQLSSAMKEHFGVE